MRKKIIIMDFSTIVFLTIWSYAAGISCPDGEWRCQDWSRCIAKKWVCDGNAQDHYNYDDRCGDGSDEDPTMCAQWNCVAGHWKCKDGLQCLDESRVCDGDMWGPGSGCNDGSDEDPVMCAEWNCSVGYWKCHDRLRCIGEAYVCDGDTFNPHCTYGSDEDPVMCAQWNCTAGYWKCKDNLQCIQGDWVCEGEAQCNDGSDEDTTLCAKQNCDPAVGYWRCYDGQSNVEQCIEEQYVCDGMNHCSDGADEDPKMCALWNCTDTDRYWKCNSGQQCVEQSWVCDGNKMGRAYGCNDRSDEEFLLCVKWNCSATGRWKCQDGSECMDPVSVCDGNKHADCSDFSDEDPAMCREWNCTAGYWKCKDGLRCLVETEVCDGYDQCDDKSDEDVAMCAPWECTGMMWKCHDGQLCIRDHYVCDGGSNCDDGSDEDPAMCALWNCTAGRWKCQDGQQCIEQAHVCDGSNTCRDSSDEDTEVCTHWTCMKCDNPHATGCSYTKCADSLQCVKREAVCNGEADCKDRSDELCDDGCHASPMKPSERDIVKKCQEDLSRCVSVKQYCDGIAQCPDGSDETQVGCTCEDWDLKSCSVGENQIQMSCINTNWAAKAAVNQSVSKCADSIHMVETQGEEQNNTDACVMVSPDGTDEPQCLDTTMDTACRTLSYPINQGVTALCQHGTFSNISENLELTYQIDQETEIDLFCKDCLLLNSEITLSCNSDKMCKIILRDVIVKNSNIRLSNIHITFSNVTLEQTLVQDHSENSNNLIQFEGSTLSCVEPSNCGLHLTNTSAAKVIFLQSRLNNFRVDISIGQLIFVCKKTDMVMPRVNIDVKSFEYLKIPAIIEFDQVTAVRNIAQLDKKEIPLRVKRNVESEPQNYYITFDLTNPYVMIKGSYFIGINLQIQSKRQEFEPVFLSLSFEKSSFIDGYNVGNGGGLAIISEVQNSEVKLLDCTFSNNSAVKGTGTIKGRGGGLYVKATSLKLTVSDCIFLDNKASDLGLALYTTEGVDVSLTNCTIKYSVDPNTPIQQSLFFVFGNIIQFQGRFKVSNPTPESYVGPIDVFYIGQAAGLSIETYCPKWYNHIAEYTSVSTDSQTIPDVKYKCIPCSDNYYSIAGESNTLSYIGNDNITLAEKLTGNQETGSCEECPYGALCTGNNVMPRPNYWGYWHEDALVFQQCPAGYCCSGSDSSTCNVYDHCPGNRTDVLCGACNNGFSVSILTGACTPDSQCGGDQWFWLVAFLAMLAYALWYTLKDDIFALFFGSIRLVKRICKRPTSKVNNIQVEMMPQNRERQSISSIEDSKLQDNANVPNKHVDNNVDNEDKKLIENEGKDDEENADKAYFGIVTYYVQMAAVIAIQIEFSDIDKSASFLDTMVNYIARFLNIELTQMSFDVCPIKGLTTVGKLIYNLVFLFGIYVCWAELFAATIIIITVLQNVGKLLSIAKGMESFKFRLITGLIEIIKYTYAGFCGIIFMSLVCAQIGNKYVWWYDGTNVCLENWQVVITIIAIFYAVPFPFSLALGMKLLKQNRISPATFVCCCIFPLVALIAMLIYIRVRKASEVEQDPSLSEASEIVISVLQGPYRDDERHFTLYWEAMVSVRRLLITGMTLVSYASIRMIIITALCLMFLLQHVYMSPFIVRTSNDVETVSLSLLLLTSVINLLKASLTDSGVVPSGPSVPFFKSIELCEKLFVLIIIAYIVLVEIRLRKGKKSRISKNK